MAEVSSELLYELMKRMHADLTLVKNGLGEVKQELISIRLAQAAMQNDITNIYGILARHDERFDRIEKRLELRELAEAGKPYDPSS